MAKCQSSQTSPDAGVSSTRNDGRNAFKRRESALAVRSFFGTMVNMAHEECEAKQASVFIRHGEPLIQLYSPPQVRSLLRRLSRPWGCHRTNGLPLAWIESAVIK